ncbi:MAG TPA: hypothetical protein VMW09_01515 [Desulfatiglandales bacterium]|nr:hypothetical protein [Desulfatiglandales bacterium]
MNREVHVRFFEGLGVKFPRATRRAGFTKDMETAISGIVHLFRLARKSAIVKIVGPNC